MGPARVWWQTTGRRALRSSFKCVRASQSGSKLCELCFCPAARCSSISSSGSRPVCTVNKVRQHKVDNVHTLKHTHSITVVFVQPKQQSHFYHASISIHSLGGPSALVVLIYYSFGRKRRCTSGHTTCLWSRACVPRFEHIFVYTYVVQQTRAPCSPCTLNITKYQHNFARLRTLTQTH